MFWKRKSKVHAAPEVDAYIHKRYEDMAVCIHLDIARDMGLYNYYAPWLDYMMNKFDLPDHVRKKNTLVITDSNGRHIGCSGAVKNTLVYYNPLPEQEQPRKKLQSVGSVVNKNIQKKNIQQAFISGGDKTTGKKLNRSDVMENRRKSDVKFTREKQAINLPITQHYKLLDRSVQNLPQSDTSEVCDTGMQDRVKRRVGWALTLGECVVGGDITSRVTSRPQSEASVTNDEKFRMHEVGKKAWEEHNQSEIIGEGGGVCGDSGSGGRSDGDRGDAVLEHSVSTSDAVSSTRRKSRICKML